MKLLLICDDYYHHSDTVIKGLDYLNDSFSLDIIEDAHDIRVEDFNLYSVILFSKSNNYSRHDRSNWMTTEMENGFVNYVKNGGSLAVIHSGTAEYKQTPIFRNLIGGVFIHHPEQCDILVEPIKDTPITKGIESFTIFDEHYHMEINDPAIEIMMNTTSKHGVQPGAWTKRVGTGKVFVFTPGHNLAVWQHPSFKNVILNAIKWST